MSRYVHKACVDPRASVYHDEDMDFSRDSFGTRTRDVAIEEPSEISHPSSPPHHPQAPRRVPPPDPPSSASVVSDSLRGSYPEGRNKTVSSDFRGSYVEDRSGIEEDVTEAVTPLKTPASVSAYVPWTGGVQYSNPENAIIEPISTEELLEGLIDMKLQREKKLAELGGGHRGTPGTGFNHNSGYGSRAGGIGRPPDQGYGNRAFQSSGGNADSWGGGGGDDDNWGVRSGGGGAGGGQARGNDCYNCGELGHVSAHCMQERKPRGGGGGGACYKCGEQGHISRECVNAPTSVGGNCFNCGQPGHESRGCQNDRVVGAFRGECHNCGEQGHAFRDCPNDRKAGAFRGTCHQCGEEGHQIRDCDQPRNPGGRYEDRNDDRGPAGFTDQGDSRGAPLATPKTPGFIRSSGDDGGWGGEHIVTPTAPAIHRGRSLDRQADEWGSPAPPANNHMNQPSPHIQTRRDDDNWSRPGSLVAENHPVKQVPTPIPAGPGPGIHPDRLRMLNQQGIAIGGYDNREEPSRGRPPHMDRGGDGYGGGGGYSNRSPSVPFGAPPQQMRQAPPIPQQSRASDENDGW